MALPASKLLVLRRSKRAHANKRCQNHHGRSESVLPMWATTWPSVLCMKLSVSSALSIAAHEEGCRRGYRPATSDVRIHGPPPPSGWAIQTRCRDPLPRFRVGPRHVAGSSDVAWTKHSVFSVPPIAAHGMRSRHGYSRITSSSTIGRSSRYGSSVKRRQVVGLHRTQVARGPRICWLSCILVGQRCLLILGCTVNGDGAQRRYEYGGTAHWVSVSDP